MTDSIQDLSTTTVKQQYKVVRTKTNDSHVMQYGDMSISPLPISQFQGDKKAKAPFDPVRVENSERVRSEDVPVIRASMLVDLAKSPQEKGAAINRLQEILDGRKLVDTTMDDITAFFAMQFYRRKDSLLVKQKLTQFEVK